ncbi:MAG: TnpV protein [Defluviitaleaceae bacterium]|nr:TnpV protein [Defluviitaleaceae bacterium]
MSKEYIPVATIDTVYYEPQTKEEFDKLMEVVKVGDMVYSKWVFSGLWYTVGLNDINDPTSICLFPNIIMDEELPQLTRWGLARYHYLKSERKFMAAGFGTVGLHKHCLEVQEQAEQRKANMMAAIRKDPANRVSERDKAENPMVWVQRMNQFQAQVHEVINTDLIFS